MLWSELCDGLQEIEQTSLRNVKTVKLAEILKVAEEAEVGKLVYLVLGGLRPEYDRLEFNLAEKGIVRALGVDWAEYQKIGDLGEMVVKAKQTNKITSQQTNLNVTEVYGVLERIARESGSGSQERKVRELARLVGQMEPTGAKYLVRMVAGKLRLGFSDRTVIDSISYLVAGDKKHSEQLVQAYQIRPDVGVLAQLVKKLGIERAITETTITVGVPVVPALAQRLKTPAEMIEKMGTVYVEPKYDGTRVQIHFRRNGFGIVETQTLFADESVQQVKTYTRNLDESSAMFPELESIGSQIKADEVILDTEAVGYAPDSGKLVPFQLTITRKRKHGVGEAQSAVPLRFFVFDIMYCDGESLLQWPLSKRREKLAQVVVGAGVLQIDDFIETDNPELLRAYHHQQLMMGLEGALVKQKTGQYLPGRTGFNWVKFKEAEDSRAKLADTIDAVVMGYYLGKGKRQQFGWGAILVGVVTEDEKIVTIGKVGTGISDELFRELRSRFKTYEGGVKNGAYEVAKNLEPDVWLEPKMIVEIAADEITKSPIHTAGYALRFPRLVRIREDKGLGQVTTKQELETMI